MVDELIIEILWTSIIVAWTSILIESGHNFVHAMTAQSILL